MEEKKFNHERLKKLGDSFIGKNRVGRFKCFISGLALHCAAEHVRCIEDLAFDLYQDANLTGEKANAYAEKLKALGVLDD